MNSAGAASRVVFGLAVVVHLVVLYAPDAPGVDTGGLRVDWLVHAAVFAAVVWTARRAGLPTTWVVVAAAVHAPLSELVQQVVLDDRSGDLTDVAADLAGVLIGVVVPTGRRPVMMQR